MYTAVYLFNSIYSRAARYIDHDVHICDIHIAGWAMSSVEFNSQVPEVKTSYIFFHWEIFNDNF